MILQYPHSALSQKCEYVTPNENIDVFLQKLHFSVKKESAIGIAANQIGIIKNIFLAIDPDTKKLLTFINSKILNYSNDICTYVEGCLSFKGFFIPIKRPSTIIISYEDEQRKFHDSVEFTGWISRIIQHEYDHINGEVFISKI